MKRALCRLLSAVSLLPLPVAASAAETAIDATTIFRFEQRDIAGASKQDLMPATQFLGLDVEKLADGNLSLHFSGWGRADLADKSYNNDRVDGSFTYGYLQYRFKEANATVRLGRLFVHEGIVNEQVDGISARTDLPLGFGLSAFGGATVHTRHLYGEKSDGKGDSIIGGRGSYRYRGVLELGASVVYEDNAPTLVNYATTTHRLVGGDIWLSPVRMVEIMGHSSYNTETRTLAEHSYLINLTPLRSLVATVEFNEQRDRSYLSAWAMFSGAALNPSDKSRSLGGSVSYDVAKNVGLSADYKHYTRELGNADRYGVTGRLSFLNNAVRTGIGYHYLRAGSGFAIATNPSASYHELHAFALYDSAGIFAALDGIDYIFKDKVYNEKSAWEGTASLGYHITPALALSGDVSYGRNPQFTEETKGLVRLTYTTTFDRKGGKKMRIMHWMLPMAFLAGLILLLAACAQMQGLHSLPASHPEALAAGQQVDCSECHDDQAKGTLKALTAFSHTPAFVKNHRFYAASDDRLCAVCHKSSFCNDCHTNKVEMKPSYKFGYRPDREMPHRGDFLTLHKIEGKLDPASCYRCHGRANNERCVACHR